jgi:hypothetical protein
MFCFIQRWRIDRALDEGTELDARARRHVAECDGCRSHRRMQEKLVALLNHPQPAPEAPPFLRANVMNAIRAEAAVHAGHSWLPPVWVPIAACAALAFYLIPGNTPQSPAPTALHSQPQPVAQAPVKMPVVELPAVNMAKTLEQVQDTLASPYTKEIESLQNDLKAAGGYMGKLFNLKIASME